MIPKKVSFAPLSATLALLLLNSVVVTPATAATNIPITNFRAAWSSTTSYGSGAVVTYAGASYISLVGSNIGVPPNTSSTNWAILDAPGATGAQGVQGVAGPAGPVGAKGATGATGAQGPVGPTGASGSTGAAGPVGPAGSPGAQGVAGPIGPLGPQGPAGTNGAVGATGVAGPIGPQGMAAGWPVVPAGPACAGAFDYGM